MPTSARRTSSRAERPAAAKREAIQCDDHPDEVRTIRHGTAVPTSQKRIACPKAGPNRSRHRSADPRRAEGHCTGARQNGLFFWTVHGPFSFRPRPKRKWGVYPAGPAPPREQRPRGRRPAAHISNGRLITAPTSAIDCRVVRPAQQVVHGAVQVVSDAGKTVSLEHRTAIHGRQCILV